MTGKEKLYVDLFLTALKRISLIDIFNKYNPMPEELANDKEFIMRIVTIRPEIVEYMGDELKKDTNFIIELIDKTEGSVFKFLDEKLRNDFRFAENSIYTIL